MLNLPRRPVKQVVSLYEPLGLTELPFSANPVLNPYSTDSRLNGTIYAEAPVQEAISKFERLLIRPTDFNNRVKVASGLGSRRCTIGARNGKNRTASILPPKD